MKKGFYKYLFFITGIACLASCKKFLQVQPQDKFTEQTLFASPGGFSDALNGIYIKTASNGLYGSVLTNTTVDVLAQYYAVPAQSATIPLYYMSQYAYTETTYGQPMIDGIWKNLYQNIAGINNFLAACETYGGVLDAKTLAAYKGEAYGLRAMMYFDLMRMFDPVYTTDSTTAILPYYDKVSADISPFQPGKFIMQKVLSDLNQSEALLQTNDAAIGQTVVSIGNVLTGRTSRNYKMNYYAVKALKARVYLWKGDKGNALSNAVFLINNLAKFPWTTPAQLQFNDPGGIITTNRIFSTEMIFGAENNDLNNVYNNNFNSSLGAAFIIAPNQTGTFIQNTVYEGLLNDYRYKYQWVTDGVVSFPTFYKYKDANRSTYAFSRTVPLLKMAEMYLIAAECEPNQTTALGYISTLRTNRNIAGITSTTNINNDIMKEYRKEFCGEGQLWFYYKRTNTSAIVYGSTNAVTAFNIANYTFPIPLSETSVR